MEDGRLGFIDFGCFQQFSRKRWRFEQESEKAMFCNDRDKIIEFLAGISFHETTDELDPDWVEMMLRQVQWVVRPIVTEGPFDFADKDYVTEGVGLFKELLQNGNSRLDCFYNWTNRAILGHRSLMYRLQCRFDYRSMYLHEMRQSEQ
jgi:hypothetical protein